MLNMNIKNQNTRDPLHIRDVLENDLLNIPVRIADHCYGCTAGQGSSCTGAFSSGKGGKYRSSLEIVLYVHDIGLKFGGNRSMGHSMD